MNITNKENYPQSLEWELKSSAMPNIPRGKNYPQSLKTILTELKEKKPYDSTINIPDSERKNTLNELCIKLRPTNIVSGSEKTEWVISNEALNWLNTGDSFYLAALLNANIKFFSEILYILSEEKCQIQKILNIATSQYKISWKTKQEILVRLNWLKDLDLVRYEDYTYNYFITKDGEVFLNEVGYFDYTKIKSDLDNTINDFEIPVSDWALKLCEITKNDERKDGIGYFPGSVNNMHDTLIEYLKLTEEPIKLQNLIDYSNDKYGIKDSSIKSFLSPLKHLNFIEQISKSEYQITSFAKQLLNENLQMNFACCIHNKYKFVFEILTELDAKKLRAKELHNIAKISYNFNYKDTAEIHKRIHILKNANLIQETGMDTYGLTNRGKKFKEIIKLSLPGNTNSTEQVETLDSENNKSLTEILYEIKDAAQDSTNPTRFEIALKNGFSLLGFKSEHLGGSGKTDILLHAPTAPKFTYSVTIDAKSTHYNEVPDSAIDFITLIEHKKKHQADFAVVVGINFGEKSRLVKRAEEHKVLLIDVNSLTDMILLHTEVPLNPDSYKKIFNQTGLIDIQILEKDRNKIKREGLLMQSIIECLSEQSEDSYTKGMVSAREIYFMLKKDIRFEYVPNIDEIKLMLELLSSPLIGCVGKEKEEYYALGSSNDAAQKFQFYFKACAIDTISE